MSDYSLSRLVGGVTEFKTPLAGVAASPRALKTIDYAHHEVHGGSHYFVTASTANASATDILGVVFTAPGTKAATMIAVTISDTDVSGGTTLQKSVLGGGQQGRTGGNAVSRSELILKQSEDYYVSLASQAANNDISFLGSWYEESS